MVSRLLRAVITVLASTFPFFYLFGSLAPIGLPSPFANGGNGGTITINFGGTFPLLPIGIAGITGFIIWSILAQVSRIVSTPGHPRLNSEIPVILPSNMTRAQYLILRAYRQGRSKTRDIAKQLSIEVQEVEAQSKSLQRNGYLTRNGKLTSKGLEVLGA